jgi:TRAP-type C4-dicarboxylate transport system substrate-binding protein
MSMKKAFLALLLAAAVTPAMAQEKNFELKLSHWVPASHPLQKALEEWGAAVEKESGGTIKSKVFPAQQLGKAFDHYDMARDGIADVTYINPGYQPGRFPIIGAGELPFLMSDAKGGSMALDAWYRKYAEKEMKDVKFCLAFIHSPSSFHSRLKKVVVPEDVKGMKVRPAHATMATFITQLGGTNVQSSAPEVRDIIERGVADAVTFPWGSVVLFGIDKVTKYHMEAPLYVTTFAFVMNKDKYNQMSDRQKKAIDNNCNTEAAGRVGEPWGKFEDAGIEKIRAEAGHEVYKLTPEQTAEWKKAAEPLVKSWADNVKKTGVDPDAAMAELRASLTKYNALANLDDSSPSPACGGGPRWGCLRESESSRGESPHPPRSSSALAEASLRRLYLRTAAEGGLCFPRKRER